MTSRAEKLASLKDKLASLPKLRTRMNPDELRAVGKVSFVKHEVSLSTVSFWVVHVAQGVPFTPLHACTSSLYQRLPRALDVLYPLRLLNSVLLFLLVSSCTIFDEI